MATVEIERVSAPPIEREDAREERERRARVLEAAALEIEVRGWIQYRDCDEDGRVCALGGIAFATGWGGPDINSHLSEDFFTGLGAFSEDADPQRFNDAAGRTQEQVTFLLRWRACEIRDGL